MRELREEEFEDFEAIADLASMAGNGKIIRLQIVTLLQGGLMLLFSGLDIELRASLQLLSITS